MDKEPITKDGLEKLKKELLKKIKLDQLEEEEKNTYQTISQKLK